VEDGTPRIQQKGTSDVRVRRPIGKSLRWAVLALLGVTLVVSGSLFVRTPEAKADSRACTSNGRSGCASFQSYGEHFYVCDYNADGYSVVARVALPGGVIRKLWNHWGAAAYNGCHDFNLSLAEGTGIAYHVCLGYYSSGYINDSTCGGNVTDRA
jgi:hypothetical protein